MAFAKRSAIFVLPAIALAAAVPQARANNIVLTFEGLQDDEAVLNYYDGGFGGDGSGPGPNYGVTFGSDSLALISSVDGGSGNFTNSPAPGETVLFFLSGPGDIMDVSAGFTTGFSFYYADAADLTGSVGVYSDLDGAGSLLATLNLSSTPNPYNVWVPIGVTFAGTAESVIFSGSANYIGFDNVTLGSATPGVPEASNTLLLLSVACSGLGLLGLRRKTIAT